jgi:dolichol-phosphate mannosyltransferase
MIRFVIPAYNERENIPNLLADLGPRASALGARIIFVDDGSTDGTAELIEEHSEGLHVAIVRHTVNRGLGTAINSGLRAALGESQDDDAIVTLEADNTSDLNDLPAMMEKFDEGADIVLASVYAPGGLQPLPVRRGAAGDPHPELAVSRLPGGHAAARR